MSAGALIVVADSADEMAAICGAFEGNLTGCIYSATDGSDDAMYHLHAISMATEILR
jgi:alpha-ketoglutaric semialdehyde dehydrogenase